ncbi:MAG: hypothetical protein ACUVSX_12035 [Aggregatilineales bacterium]
MRWARATTLLLALVLLVDGAAAAQPAPPLVYCGDLPPADCGLLRGAVERLAEIGAAAFDLSYGSYVYHGADGSVDLLFNLTAAGAARARDGSLLAALNALLFGLEADLTATLTLGAPLRARRPALADGPAQALLADGALYHRIGGANGASAWARCDLVAASAPLPAATAQASRVQQRPFITGLDPIALEAALGPEIARRYATVARSDYNNSAMFVTQVDIPGLYANPDFLALWAERAAERGIASPDFDNLAAAAAAILPHTLKVVRYGVDPQTGYLNHVDTWALLDAAALLEAALRGHDVTGWDIASMTLTLDLSAVSAAPPVALPAEETASRPADQLCTDLLRPLFLAGLLPAQTEN